MSYKETMSARFKELDKERNKILAVLEPFQDELEKAVSLEGPTKVLREKIVKVRAPLYEIDMERAAIARAIKTVV